MGGGADLRTAERLRISRIDSRSAGDAFAACGRPVHAARTPPARGTAHARFCRSPVVSYFAAGLTGASPVAMPSRPARSGPGPGGLRRHGAVPIPQPGARWHEFLHAAPAGDGTVSVW